MTVDCSVQRGMPAELQAQQHAFRQSAHAAQYRQQVRRAWQHSHAACVRGTPCDDSHMCRKRAWGEQHPSLGGGLLSQATSTCRCTSRPVPVATLHLMLQTCVHAALAVVKHRI